MLDEECTKYGNGSGVESVRSLRVEDINRISGYDPESPEKKDIMEKVQLESMVQWLHLHWMTIIM